MHDLPPEKQADDNPALSGPPVRSFLKYAIPSALGILAMSTASVVDGIFVGRYEGSDALAAVNLIIPVFGIIFGVAYMLAVGGSVNAGKYIGENNRPAASAIFSKTLVATLIYSSVLLVAGLAASEALFAALGAEPELYPMMQDYFGTLIWFLPAQLATPMLYFFVRIAGHPKLAATALIVGAASNLLLDYWLIAVRGDGLVGAAIATGTSNVITLGILACYWARQDSWLQFSLFQKDWRELLHSSFNGLSEFINEISAGVVTGILNLVIIKQLGVDGVAAFSVVSYGLFIGLLFSFSIADALQAVSSQCYGARNAKRVQQFIRIACTIVVASATVCIVLLTTQAETLIQLFVTDGSEHLQETAIGFVNVLWPVFLLNGLNVVLSAYLTAIHHAAASASIAISRSLVLPLTLIGLLISVFPELPFLMAVTGAEALTLILAVALFYRYRPSRVII